MNYIIMPGLKYRDGIASNIKPEQIIQTVSEYFNVTIKDLLGTCREHPICEARHIAMWIIRKYCKKGTIFIGKLFNKDHTTVCHACQQVKNKMETEDSFKNDMHNIFSQL